MYRYLKFGFYFMLTVFLLNCKKPYNPPAIAAPASYLVVEGTINTGADSTIFKLSKTVNLSSKVTTNPVLHAVITVESDQSSTFPLTETAKGYYSSGNLNLDNTRQYRLRIKTADNKEYLSAFVPVVNTPAIDSVSFVAQNEGMQFYVSTHDPKNTAHYYRWDYNETWTIHTQFYSAYKSNGDTVIERKLPGDQIYECWVSDTSSTIVLGSSALLTKDVIFNNPLTLVPSNSGKFYAGTSVLNTQGGPASNAYSILVRQYALTGDAYTFWTNLKKNTEQLGSIFDAQPSQINGNIRCVTNPAEAVIGYVSASNITSQRIFVANNQIPSFWLKSANYSSCSLDSLYLSFQPHGATVPINQENEFFNYNSGPQYGGFLLIPILPLFNNFGILLGHTGAPQECVDCTLKGTSKQPSFWK